MRTEPKRPIDELFQRSNLDLTDNDHWDGNPVWSPNGQQIAVGTLVMDADGSNARQLDLPAEDPAGVGIADWSHPRRR